MVEHSMRPAATLFVARAVYAFNWYNVGAVLPIIGGSLALGTAALGIVLGAFLVGVGIFQIPAGIAAIRWGARRVSLFGLLFMGAACLASALVPSFGWLVGTRFLAGVGAAFFFSPGLSLIASYYPPGRRGPVIGLYNGGFSLGGAIGLVGGLIAGELLGWQFALGVGGATLLLIGALAVVLLPPELPERLRPWPVRSLLTASRPILASRSIWALSLALTGFWGATYIVAQYFVQFVSVDHIDWGAGFAGLIVAAFVVMSLPGGPVGGLLAERGWDRRLVLAVAGVIASAIVLTIGWASQVTIWPILLALGFVDGVIFAVLYLIPSYLPESKGTSLALGVALVNSIQVGLGAVIAVLFGFLAEAFGFTWAWVFAGAVSFAALPLLLWVRPNRATPTTFVGVSADVRGSAPEP